MSHDKDLTNTRELIIQIMTEVPETRNSDLLLQWIFLKKHHGVNLPQLSYDQMKELEGRTETIRRIRQKIQNTDRLLPPTRKEVMKRRRQKESDYKEYFGKGE
jgi:hypothetical protein